MTTLAADKIRDILPGDLNDFPVIASDIVYGGAAVGLVNATGHVRPLTSADRFVGFCQRQADNSLGVAAAINCRVIRSGRVQLAISGAVITDIGAHVWATDDDAFGFTGVSGVYVGRVTRYVSSGVVEVEFDADRMRDPFLGLAHKLKSANYTVDATDTGTVLWVDTDAVVITLPAVEGINDVVVANAAAYGVSGVAISPNAADMIEAAGITAADNKDLINTKATARRGDFARIQYGDANGWSAVQVVGTWAREA